MPDISISLHPARPLIEQEPHAQHLNFDFEINNPTDENLHLSGIEMSVYDASNALVLQKFMDGNDSAPNILTVTHHIIPANDKKLIFNPFQTFWPHLPLHRLHYRFEFEGEDSETIFTLDIEVDPQIYGPQTVLSLPLLGPFLVYDGHDTWSHHRRFDYCHPIAYQIGIASNFMRYAYDFCPVDDQGQMVQGDPSVNENWLGFGAEIYAPSAGRVVALLDGMADNRSFDQTQLVANPMILFGNHLVIDHLNGEFSLFAHLQENSIKVQIGNDVNLDEYIACIGASGSANIPHLHYELRDGLDHLAEGLPSYFSQFQRKIGSQLLPIDHGLIDTGEIIQRV